MRLDHLLSREPCLFDAAMVVVLMNVFGVVCGLLWEVGMLLGFGIIDLVLPVFRYRLLWWCLGVVLVWWLRIV